MGGRGTFASGKNVAYTYKTVGKIEGVKVLQGLNGKHNLPEEAHSSSAYIKLKPDGTFHEMRIYDKDHYLTFEIAYHKEKSLGSGDKPILHYHIYDKSFNHSNAIKATKAMYKKYKKISKGSAEVLKNGELRDFIDGLYYGYEMLFEYNGIKYFIQGWNKDGKSYMFLDIPDKNQKDYLWKYEAPTMRECAETFLSQKLWNNKNFYEIEKDVSWVDW